MQANLAKVFSGLLVGKGICNLLQRVAAVDDGGPAPLLQRAHHVLLLFAAADDQALQDLLLAHQLHRGHGAGHAGEYANQRDMAISSRIANSGYTGTALRSACPITSFTGSRLLMNPIKPSKPAA